MSVVDTLEKKLDEVFVKNAPPLPENVKKWIVTYLPWINLVLGVFTLLAAISIWRWANTANQIIDAANQLTQAYGVQTDLNRLTLWIWVSLAVLAVQAILYLAAFPGLKALKKSGWNLIFYAALVNIVYGIVALFNNYGGVGNFIMSLIGSAIGLYFLFQIRSHYKKA